MEKSKQTAISFPRIEVEVFPKEVIAHFLFLDIVSPFAFFKKPKEEKREKEAPEHLEPVQNERDCAIKALQGKEFAGYEYCVEDETKTKAKTHSCDLLDEKLIGSKKTDKKQCVIMEKIDSAKAPTFNYKTTNDKIDLIKTAAEEGSLKVDTHKSESLVFSQLHRIAEESEIDRSKLYEIIGGQNQKVVDKKAVKILKSQEGILNLQSCFEACSDPLNNYVCDSFSFCKRFDVLYECSLVNYRQLDKDGIPREEILEKDDECDYYTVSATRYFQQHENQKLKAEEKEGGPILGTYAATGSAECAQDCLTYNMENNDKQCLSIEVCENADKHPECRLSSEHTLWKGDAGDVMKPDTSCNVFSLKHLINFTPAAKTKLENFYSEKVKSIDQCATACEVNECQQFNYCERDVDNHECRYVSEKEGGEKKNTELDSEEINCVSYVRSSKSTGTPKLPFEEAEETVDKFTGLGFRRGSVVGLVFLFLFIGLFVGGGGYYGKKRYLGGGGGSDGGENATITFSNLNRENDD